MPFATALFLQAEAAVSLLLMFLLVFFGIVLLVIAIKTIRIVPQASVMLIERLGRFNRVAASGLNILWPFMDRPRAVYWTNSRPGMTSIDLREQYLVAYSPANKARDGSYRRIQIEVIDPDLRKQNLKLNYRPGYFAKTPGAVPAGNSKKP